MSLPTTKGFFSSLLDDAAREKVETN